MFDTTDISDAGALERRICDLGLFPHTLSKLSEYPDHLHDFCGKGVGIWQYPSQFAGYLIYLRNEFAKRPILKYAEIGVAAGGTFTATREFLLLLCRIHGIPESMLQCVGIDPAGPGGTFRGGKTPFADGFKGYIKRNSDTITFHSAKSDDILEDVMEQGFDLVLVDGDHSYEGVSKDFETVRGQSRIVVLHDIVSDACPGVCKKWKEIKDAGYDTVEFVQQYFEDKSFLGIGVVKPREAYVTMANKPEYIVQCLVLSASIRKQDKTRDIVLMIFDEDHDVAKCLESNFETIRDLKITVKRVKNPVDIDTLPPSYKEHAARYLFDYVKLLAFTMVQYSCLVFMDGDMLVCSPLDSLFEMQTPGFVNHGATWIAASDGPCSPLNSGLVRIQPSLADYDDIMRMVYGGKYEREGGWYGEGGVFKGSAHTQGIFSWYFKDRIFKLDRKVYNNQVEEDMPSEGIDAIKVFHMTGHGKPRQVRKIYGPRRGSLVSMHVHSLWNQIFKEYNIHDN